MDKATFEALYLAALPAMHRVARSILWQEADVQDALQEAAARAWTWADRLREDGGQAYLMRIVINECRNIQRRRQRLVPVEQVPERVQEEPDDDLADALARLPEKLRLPLLLKYMEGCSEKETARALGITVPAVKSRLLRGRKALAEILREEVEWE